MLINLVHQTGGRCGLPTANDIGLIDRPHIHRHLIRNRCLESFSRGHVRQGHCAAVAALVPGISQVYLIARRCKSRGGGGHFNALPGFMRYLHSAIWQNLNPEPALGVAGAIARQHGLRDRQRRLAKGERNFQRPGVRLKGLIRENLDQVIGAIQYGLAIDRGRAIDVITRLNPVFGCGIRRICRGVVEIEQTKYRHHNPSLSRDSTKSWPFPDPERPIGHPKRRATETGQTSRRLSSVQRKNHPSLANNAPGFISK